MRGPAAGVGGRRVAWAMVLLGGAAFVALAVLLVPWQPVPGGRPPPVADTDVLTAGELARAEEFVRTARLLGWSSLAVSLAVSALLGFTSLGTRLLGRLRLPWPLTVVGLVAGVLLLGRLATLPLGLLNHRHRVGAGLSTQSTGAWLVDVAKGVGLGIVVTSIALLVLVGCARRWRTWWPAVAGALAAGLVVVGSFVYPVLVEPLFNDFTPLEDGPLREQILGVAEAEEVVVDDVLVADASRRTTTLNAYVSGFGSTRRVVVYDTLLESQPDDQIVSVVAHELAHASYDDVVTGTLLGAAGSVAGVGLLALVLGSARVRRRAGVRGASDPRVVALVLALAAVGGVASSPVQSTISRQIEARADVAALTATGDAAAFVELQRALCRRSLCDPTPPAWSQLWFGSHPTAVERVALARRISRR
ncbi:M48 family metalloprotease [Nocardioides donggukensis]|uniref:M48 family metalloprotease n=1 Tax=Nocardioides donggukensis TaxID=2774019 RepID=A0A927Q0N6_9ACTN|nr:M48 family metalloprotease [Nocardioides donggukensis]MBD8869147.1 M48 family metalloprotease [Nocardioides donggukensis]